MRMQNPCSWEFFNNSSWMECNKCFWKDSRGAVELIVDVFGDSRSLICCGIKMYIVRINSGKECILHSLSNIHDPRPQRAAPSRSHNTLPPPRRRDSSPLKGARLPEVAPIAYGRGQSKVAPIYNFYRTSCKVNLDWFHRLRSRTIGVRMEPRSAVVIGADAIMVTSSSCLPQSWPKTSLFE